MLFIAEFSVLLTCKLELIHRRSERSGKKPKQLKNSSDLNGSFLCPDLGLHSSWVLLDTDCSAAQLVAYVATWSWMTGNFGSRGCLGNKYCMMMLVFRQVRDRWNFFVGLFVLFGRVFFPILSFSFPVTCCTGKRYLLRKHLFCFRNCTWHLCVLCKSLCPAHKIDAGMVELATSKGELCFVTVWKQPEVQVSKHLLQWRPQL